MSYGGVAAVDDPARPGGGLLDASLELERRQFRPARLMEDAVELDVRDAEAVGQHRTER
jgi:hypothetical protein